MATGTTRASRPAATTRCTRAAGRPPSPGGGAARRQRGRGPRLLRSRRLRGQPRRPPPRLADDTVGRGQYTLRFRDLASGAAYATRYDNVEPGLAWTADCRTLLYVEKHPATLLGYRVCATGSARRRGTRSSTRRATRASTRRRRRQDRGASSSSCPQSTVSSEYRYARAADPALGFRVALPRERDHEYHLEDLGERFMLRTNWRRAELPHRRVAVRRGRRPQRLARLIAHARRASSPVRRVPRLPRGRRALRRPSRMRVRPWDGAREFLIDADGRLHDWLGANEEIDSDAAALRVHVADEPPRTFDYDMASGARSFCKRDPVLGGFDPRATRPSSSARRRATARRSGVARLSRATCARDGTAPLLQYAYGAYGLSRTRSSPRAAVAARPRLRVRDRARARRPGARARLVRRRPAARTSRTPSPTSST